MCYFSVASAAFNLTAVWSQMGFSSQLDSGCSCQQGYFQYFLNGVELRGGLVLLAHEQISCIRRHGCRLTVWQQMFQ